MISTSKLLQLQRLAKKELIQSLHKYKVGAVIFKNGKIISTGYNVSKGTSALARKYFQHASMHAEITAVLRYMYHSDILKGADIFVYRESIAGVPRLSKPCAMCVSVLQEMGIRRAYWSTDTFPHFDCAKVSDMFSKLNHREVMNNNAKEGN